MICQVCGVEAPTKHVSFHQNIGALVMRFSRSLDGNLCKSCIHQNFWTMTGITAAVGWFGVISFILTPIFILNNTIRYAMCLGMPPVPPNAAPPELTTEAVNRLQPHLNRLAQRLNAGEDFQRVVQDTADQAGVSAGQVCALIQALSQSK